MGKSEFAHERREEENSREKDTGQVSFGWSNLRWKSGTKSAGGETDYRNVRVRGRPHHPNKAARGPLQVPGAAVPFPAVGWSLSAPFSSRLTPQGSWASAGRGLTYQVLGLSILLPGGDPGQPRAPTCHGCPVTRRAGGCTRGNTNWEVRQAEGL